MVLAPLQTFPATLTLTIVNVMRSISCLSLVLCCRKGLCLDKGSKTNVKEQEWEN